MGEQRECKPCRFGWMMEAAFLSLIVAGALTRCDVNDHEKRLTALEAAKTMEGK